VTAPSGPWSMCGVETVGMIFGGGAITVVETGVNIVMGEGVAEIGIGSADSVLEAVTGEVPGKELPGAQANRIRVQKRAGRRTFLIFA
jgi:hypothetical protein